MSKDTKIEIRGENAVFTLANGETIYVTFAEAGCGVDGYGLKVMSDRGTILLQPSSGNACVVKTERSHDDERAAVNAAVEERRASKAAKAAKPAA